MPLHHGEDTNRGDELNPIIQVNSLRSSCTTTIRSNAAIRASIAENRPSSDQPRLLQHEIGKAGSPEICLAEIVVP
jgi:hypothetical protein